MIHDMRSLFAALMLVAACGDGDVTPPPADPCAGWPAASFFNTSSALQACLDAGGDPNARDDEGRTPLHKAATAQNAEAIRALLAAGARMGTSDYYGRTPLCVAAEVVADTDVMHALLSARPIIDTECQRRSTRWTGEGERPNGEMVTALCLASGYNSPEIRRHPARRRSERQSALLRSRRHRQLLPARLGAGLGMALTGAAGPVSRRGHGGRGSSGRGPAGGSGRGARRGTQ